MPEGGHDGAWYCANRPQFDEAMQRNFCPPQGCGVGHCARDLGWKCGDPWPDRYTKAGQAEIVTRQALAATIPADDGAGEAVKLAFTWAYARGFQVADETSRSCIGSIDDAWQDYLAALRPTGEEKP
jgi:hypothetical protein